MTRVLVLGLIGVLICGVAYGQIMDKPKVAFGSAGASVPERPEPFTDEFDLGPVAGGGLGLVMSPALTVLGAFDFSWYRGEPRPITTVYPWVGARYYPLTELSVRPYLVAGAGLYNIRVRGSDWDFNIGLNGGLGVEWDMSEDRGLFVEAMAVGGFTSGPNTGIIPIRIGMLIRGE